MGAQEGADAGERSAFVRRLQAAADLVGSVNALAKRAGVSQAGLRGYLFGSEPTRRILNVVADAAGVSRSWLYNGDGEMLSAGSPILNEASKAVRSAWEAFNKATGHGERTANWTVFAERYLAGDEALGVPLWVRFAVPDPNSIFPARAGKSAAGSGPLAHTAARPNVPSGLIAAVSRELRHIDAGDDVELADRGALGESFDEILDAACRDLLAGAIAHGHAPDMPTIRKMIDAHMWRLGLTADVTKQRAAETEFAEA